MSYLHDYFLTPPSTSNMNINIRKRPGERVNTTDVKRTHNNSEVLQQNDCYQANQVHYGNFPNPNFNFYSNQNQIPSMYTWSQGTPFTPPRDPFQGLSYTNIQTPGNYAPIPNSMFCTPE
uniref:Uncharacterized protein n=1 Tax=Caenorhabditis japonica TaxID=281687 RepID=A0A8R1ITE5_CAEJA